ncbi:MAG TPA: amidohydrolase family protein [Patescibacteria group bacterium]|nr:amidohydrolase family protein [Patescibacteria group bacterium]
MGRKIIDMRSRPAFLHDFYGATPGTAGFEAARWLNRRVGSKDDRHFIASHSLDGFVGEIRTAGITRAVVVGRDTPALSIPNDTIASLTSGHDELVGIGSVDPQAQGTRGAVAEVERAVVQLGLKAINVEPGFGAPPLKADDPLLLPVYDACQQLDVPVFVMSGPTTPDPDFNDPAAIGRLALNFPRLRIVCHHGFWPHVAEIVGVAFRHENVFLVPDMYLFLPGSGLYVEAANGFMRDQFLFGSSYPFRPMKQTIDDFLALGIREEVLNAVLFDNADRVLKLGLTPS